MQDDPNGFFQFISNLPAPIGGVIMAMFVSVIRVVYDREETSAVRIGLESVICGCLTLAGGSLASAMGLGDGYHLFIGGAVGFLGSLHIKQFAMRFLDKRIDK
jgi:lambda family phage holin